jgi:hypothetical protein
VTAAVGRNVVRAARSAGKPSFEEIDGLTSSVDFVDGDGKDVLADAALMSCCGEGGAKVRPGCRFVRVVQRESGRSIETGTTSPAGSTRPLFLPEFAFLQTFLGGVDAVWTTSAQGDCDEVLWKGGAPDGSWSRER